MSEWTDDKVQTLRASWDAGDSAAIIGAALGFSRNAVLGKVWRLGLAQRRTVKEVPRVRASTFSRAEFFRPSKRAEPEAKVEAARYNIKSPRIVARRPPVRVEQTKNDLRRMLRDALLNTGGTPA